MKNKPLKVGFDLDGVILYNPARIVRPIITGFKKKFLKKKRVKFYVPDTPFQQWIWKMFHKSSLFTAPGFEEIEKMVKRGEIEAYIITARYDFLKDDFHHWLKQKKADTYLKAWFHNKDNEQPHIYKEKKVKELGLDLFVEDNFDIVSHLTKKYPDKPILWIYNILDKKNDYPHKFPGLQQAIEHIKNIQKDSSAHGNNKK